MGSLKTEYDELGVVVKRQLINQDLVNEILGEIQRFRKSYEDQMSERDINYIGDAINSIHCLHKFEDQYFQDFFKSDKITQLAQDLLADTPEVRGAETFMKPAGLGLMSPMHQDDFYWCVSGHNALTIWIALDEANAENGGVEYVQKSHKLGLIDHVPSHAPGSSQKIPDEVMARHQDQKIIHDLKPGDALIHHALTIHGSNANNSERSRRGLTVQFKGQSSPYDLQRKENYEKSLADQVKARKN